MLLIGGIIAVVVIIIVVVIIVVILSGKKKKREAAARQAQMQGQMPNRPPVQPAPQQRPQSAPVPPQPPHGMTMDAGAGETSVLGSGAGETSVLSGNMQPAATLIRRKNGETARISKASFAIGRERQKVDFCVPDNNSVGRTHANIICKGGVYYIVDNNSTNFTFVNGNKIGPNQEVKLNSGDKIKLADEEFEFRM
ncbi:MAG: FHA domain-containing protein [Lachnospiraceae bacterium]|nr:FHA domain-containing protein [Lachnospiraceae bacterium]